MSIGLVPMSFNKYRMQQALNPSQLNLNQPLQVNYINYFATLLHLKSHILLSILNNYFFSHNLLIKKSYNMCPMHILINANFAVLPCMHLYKLTFIVLFPCFKIGYAKNLVHPSWVSRDYFLESLLLF